MLRIVTEMQSRQSSRSWWVKIVVFFVSVKSAYYVSSRRNARRSATRATKARKKRDNLISFWESSNFYIFTLSLFVLINKWQFVAHERYCSLRYCRHLVSSHPTRLSATISMLICWVAWNKNVFWLIGSLQNNIKTTNFICLKMS